MSAAPARRTARSTGRGVRLIVAALAIALATRAALAVIAWFALRVFGRHDPYPAQLPDSFFPDRPFLDGWARWDAAHYVAIAQLGYGDGNPSPHGGVGFFPLYPLLMRALVEIAGVFGAAPTAANYALAGLVIANGCFFAAVAVLARFAAAHLGERAAIETVLLFCLMPFSFFCNAAYSESLFVLLVLLALARADDRRWWLAPIIAGLATGTRLVGLALAPALLYVAYRRGARPLELLATGMLSVWGIVAYFGYLAVGFDDPLAYFDAQSQWGGWDEHVRFYADLFFTHPRQALTGRPEDLIVALDLAAGLVFLVFLPRVWRLGLPAVAIVTILLVVVQGAFTWLSLGRYVLPALGVYLAAAAWLASPRWSGWPRDVVLAVSGFLLVSLTVLYATGFWVV